MNGYDELLAMVAAIASEFDVVVTTRPLRGSRDEDDQLIIERSVGDRVRVLRIPAASSNVGLRAFYWGDLPSGPGTPHAEGKWLGDEECVRRVVRRFIFELVDWRAITDEVKDLWSRGGSNP